MQNTTEPLPPESGQRKYAGPQTARATGPALAQALCVLDSLIAATHTVGNAESTLA